MGGYSNFSADSSVMAAVTPTTMTEPGQRRPSMESAKSYHSRISVDRRLISRQSNPHSMSSATSSSMASRQSKRSRRMNQKKRMNSLIKSTHGRSMTLSDASSICSATTSLSDKCDTDDGESNVDDVESNGGSAARSVKESRFYGWGEYSDSSFSETGSVAQSVAPENDVDLFVAFPDADECEASVSESAASGGKFEDIVLEDEYDSRRPWRKPPPGLVKNKNEISSSTVCEEDIKELGGLDAIEVGSKMTKFSSLGSGSKTTNHLAMPPSVVPPKIGTIISTNGSESGSTTSRRSFQSGSDVSELVLAQAALKESEIALSEEREHKRGSIGLSVSTIKTDFIPKQAYRKPEPFLPGLTFERKFTQSNRNISNISLGSMMTWKEEQQSWRTFHTASVLKEEEEEDDEEGEENQNSVVVVEKDEVGQNEKINKSYQNPPFQVNIQDIVESQLTSTSDNNGHTIDEKNPRKTSALSMTSTATESTSTSNNNGRVIEEVKSRRILAPSKPSAAAMVAKEEEEKEMERRSSSPSSSQSSSSTNRPPRSTASSSTQSKVSAIRPPQTTSSTGRSSPSSVSTGRSSPSLVSTPRSSRSISSTSRSSRSMSSTTSSSSISEVEMTSMSLNLEEQGLIPPLAKAKTKKDIKKIMKRRSSITQELAVVNEFEEEDNWDDYSAANSSAQKNQEAKDQDESDQDESDQDGGSNMTRIDRNAERDRFAELQHLHDESDSEVGTDTEIDIPTNRRRNSTVGSSLVSSTVTSHVSKSVKRCSTVCKRNYFRHKYSLYLSVLIALIVVLGTVLTLYIFVNKAPSSTPSPSPPPSRTLQGKALNTEFPTLSPTWRTKTNNPTPYKLPFEDEESFMTNNPSLSPTILTDDLLHNYGNDTGTTNLTSPLSPMSNEETDTANITDSAPSASDEETDAVNIEVPISTTSNEETDTDNTTDSAPSTSDEETDAGNIEVPIFPMNDDETDATNTLVVTNSNENSFPVKSEFDSAQARNFDESTKASSDITPSPTSFTMWPTPLDTYSKRFPPPTPTYYDIYDAI